MAEKTEKWKAARTKNLTAAQMKQARRVVGGKRSEAVSGTERKAAKKAVDISGTKWMKASERGGKGRGGLLVDSSGKAVTGTVTLPSGQKCFRLNQNPLVRCRPSSIASKKTSST